MATLREMKDGGWSITLYCLSAVGSRCHHSWTPSWDQLIQYFGAEFDLTGDRALFGRLVCDACGQRGASVIVDPPDIPHRGIGGHRTTIEAVSIEEATRRHHEMATERKRLGIKTNAEMGAESRAKLKAHRLAERRGDFIGPPNPWAHRKKGRWL